MRSPPKMTIAMRSLRSRGRADVPGTRLLISQSRSAACGLQAQAEMRRDLLSHRLGGTEMTSGIKLAIDVKAADQKPDD
jgi:hypothetical protein